MTRDEIMAMPAGREMDRRVAAFMGDVYDGQWNTWVSRDGSRRISCADFGPQEYSTSIAAAWQVVECLLAKGHHVGLLMEPQEMKMRAGEHELSVPGKTRCIVTEDYDVRLWAGTAPLAICRAALLAVQVKEEAAS